MVGIKPKVYRARQIAEVYSIGISTVWRFAREGKLTPRKITDKVTVFSIEECDKFFCIANNICEDENMNIS